MDGNIEWEIRFEPEAGDVQWHVYSVLSEDSKTHKASFAQEKDALDWVRTKEKEIVHPENTGLDKEDAVEEASLNSFPASDPPAWISHHN